VGVRNGRELRRIVELPFVVFYAPTHDRITIFRVLHGARDFQAILDEIFESDPE
jgi:plasmid stabilization system protein ParE